MFLIVLVSLAAWFLHIAYADFELLDAGPCCPGLSTEGKGLLYEIYGLSSFGSNTEFWADLKFVNRGTLDLTFWTVTRVIYHGPEVVLLCDNVDDCAPFKNHNGIAFVLPIGSTHITEPDGTTYYQTVGGNLQLDVFDAATGVEFSIALHLDCSDYARWCWDYYTPPGESTLITQSFIEPSTLLPDTSIEPYTTITGSFEVLTETTTTATGATETVPHSSTITGISKTTSTRTISGNSETLPISTAHVESQSASTVTAKSSTQSLSLSYTHSSTSTFVCPCAKSTATEPLITQLTLTRTSLCPCITQSTSLCPCIGEALETVTVTVANAGVSSNPGSSSSGTNSGSNGSGTNSGSNGSGGPNSNTASNSANSESNGSGSSGSESNGSGSSNSESNGSGSSPSELTSLYSGCPCMKTQLPSLEQTGDANILVLAKTFQLLASFLFFL